METDSYLEILQENINNNRFIKIGNGQLDKNFDFLKSQSTIKIADIIEGSDFLPGKENTLSYSHTPIQLFWKLSITSNTMPNCYSKYDVPHLKKKPTTEKHKRYIWIFSLC